MKKLYRRNCVTLLAKPCTISTTRTCCIHRCEAEKVKITVAKNQGFTLIELSIVLVIIGLIVGGIFVGQDLINAARIRAQISQIGKFNVAVNTFLSKYNALPGDIADPHATAFGFVSRGQNAGQGDGDGSLTAYNLWYSQNYGGAWGGYNGGGETGMFWVDLTYANLIEGQFSTANPITFSATDITGSALNLYLPGAKINANSFVYVYNNNNTSNNGKNYFGLSGVTKIRGGDGALYGSLSISVQTAYLIDSKIDDGFPQSGQVLAQYETYSGGSLSSWFPWAGRLDVSGPTPDPYARSGSSTTCYDNGNANGAQQKYSTSQNGGAGINCALSFQFQ